MLFQRRIYKGKGRNTTKRKKTRITRGEETTTPTDKRVPQAQTKKVIAKPTITPTGGGSISTLAEAGGSREV